MSKIAKYIKEFKTLIPEGITLVAVSKTKPVADIIEAYNSGQRVFGENRVQEIVDKFPELPSDLRLHMIGHLQTNKVKYIIDKVKMIEGVDSFKLINFINKEASKHNIVIDVLLQFYIADEDTKFGFSIDEITDLLDNEMIQSLDSVKIRGVMGMATFTDDMEQVRSEFRSLKKHFDFLKNLYFSDDPLFSEISMGMSGDYKIAIEEGSTMIRVGSAIFGSRY